MANPAVRLASIALHLQSTGAGRSGGAGHSFDVSPRPELNQPMADIIRERKNASFDINLMQTFLDGGKDYTRAKEIAYQIIRRDPILLFDGGNDYDLTRPEAREKSMAQVRRFVEIYHSLKNPIQQKAFEVALSSYSESFGMRLYVHHMLFRNSIKMFASEEQKKRTTWVKDIDDFSVLGCFAMTELGHSSSLRDLEATATFDPATDSFILHSPTLTSTKWWIGMSGQAATHTVFLAQTIIKGKHCGLNWFMVPLRDRHTGRLFPGVTCGDIGAKAGRHGLDNGWIQLTQVRIPRDNMLMRWSQIDREGNITEPPNQALVYATLIAERLCTVDGTNNLCGQALTIATRYSCARRQGTSNQQIMDYQTHYVNLMPGVAGMYVLSLVDRCLWAYWDRMEELSRTNTDEYLQYLNDIHCVAAGTKASITWWGSEILERCRRAMGGHGFSAYSGIPSIIGDWGVFTTGGGDNFPLAQQTARYVLNCVNRSMQGKPNFGSAEYLKDIKVILEFNVCPADSVAAWLDLAILQKLFASLTVKLAMRIGQHLAPVAKKGQEKVEAVWNEHQLDVLRLSHLHTIHYLISLFTSSVSSLPSEYSSLKPILTKVGLTWALDMAVRDLDLMLEEEFVSAAQAQNLRVARNGICKELRNDVVPLMDAFGRPDFLLKSPLGRYDGDIYNAYFDTVTRAPDCYGPANYWSTEVEPLLTRVRP
ncbi:acyl-CoA oxidase [Spizellomyces sp. 'palustris']|nr:acyl-CoA oxidase [Spizellomyces sp. 'palustris']